MRNNRDRACGRDLSRPKARARFIGEPPVPLYAPSLPLAPHKRQKPRQRFGLAYPRGHFIRRGGFQIHPSTQRRKNKKVCPMMGQTFLFAPFPAVFAIPAASAGVMPADFPNGVDEPQSEQYENNSSQHDVTSQQHHTQKVHHTCSDPRDDTLHHADAHGPLAAQFPLY